MNAIASPRFSIVTPVYNPPPEVLAETIRSVQAQTWTDWELILVDDKSTIPGVVDVLRRAAASDDRVVVVERETNGHIVAASNDGVARARGAFVGFLDHDDLLDPRALSRYASVIDRHDDVDYLYSNEDIVAMDGKVVSTFNKPAWSPERLRGQNYCNHFSVFRSSLIDEVGGFREGFEGSQDHDLVLRVTERARRVEHVDEVLYHWRMAPDSTASDPHAKPYVFEAGRRAVSEHFGRLGIEAEVEVGQISQYVIKRPLPTERRVSIVIPTIGSKGMVWGRERVFVLDAVRSALAKTSHDNLEVVVVYDPPTPAEVLEELGRIAGDKLVLVPFREKFNYSRKMNFGVLASTGDRLVLLNDDVEVRDADWLVELLGPLEEESVGQTGAFLYFSSNTIQHAGVAVTHGAFTHPFVFHEDGFAGPFGTLLVSREVSGVTGACVGMRRDVFLEAGGFTEVLPENYNDVDLSWKLRHLGYRNIVVPRCRLYHFETQSRQVKGVANWEISGIRARWGYQSDDSFTKDFWNESESPSEQRAARIREARREKLS